MVETTFNLFDAIVILVLGLSSLLSFFRGFVRELLSLGAWIGASLLALYCAPDVADMLKGQVKHEMGAYILASLMTFFTALIVISIFNSLLMKLFKRGKDIGLLDNALGLAFGVLRASLLLSLGYYIMTFVMSEKNFPEWMETSHTRPYVAKGAELLANVAPDYLDSITPISGGEGVELPNNETLNNLLEKSKQMKDGAGEVDILKPGDESGLDLQALEKRKEEIRRMIEERKANE